MVQIVTASIVAIVATASIQALFHAPRLKYLAQ